jgi:hypothetical protein
VVDSAWRDMFTDVKVHHLVSSRSDHCPLLVEARQVVWERRDQRIFRYEIMWERVDSLAIEIRKLWCSIANRGNLNSIMHTLLNMKGALRQWSKCEFGAVTEEINKLRKELEHARARTPANRMEIGCIADRMDEVLYREEMMWLQCS